MLLDPPLLVRSMPETALKRDSNDTDCPARSGTAAPGAVTIDVPVRNCDWGLPLRFVKFASLRSVIDTAVIAKPHAEGAPEINAIAASTVTAARLIHSTGCINA